MLSNSRKSSGSQVVGFAALVVLVLSSTVRADLRDHKLTIAHRGAHREITENTLAAVERAFELGADAVEVDIQLTLDEEPVLLHDATLARTFGSHYCIASMPWGFAKLARTESGEPLPHLNQLLSLLAKQPRLPSVPFVGNIELKAYSGGVAGCPATDKHRLGARVVEQIEKFGLAERVILSSFDQDVLAAAREHSPHIRLAWIVGELTESVLITAQARGYYAVNPGYRSLTRKNLRRARSLGLEIFPWTIRDSQDYNRLLKDKDISGLITDYLP